MMNNKRIWAMLLAMLACVVGGCGVTRNALPAELVAVAQPVGIENVRAWGDEPSALFQRDFVESIRQAREHSPVVGVDKHGWVSVLALSGGGSRGAFGAGFLAGWTASGRRPEFKLVTGVSAGALIAPFAFLGPDYDATLRKFYTTITTDDVLQLRPLNAVSGGDAIADSAPLVKLINEAFTEAVMADVAREHARGRRLYILTTNLDARRAVVWNMGAIAASGKPNALALFRQVLRASASIPVALEPVYIPVQAGGGLYDEMHVDGGVSSEVFFYGSMLDIPAGLRAAGVTERPKVRIFILRNSQVRAGYQQVRPRMQSIARRAMVGLIDSQAVGDMYRIYTMAQRDGIGFNLAYIPETYTPASAVEFEPAAMTELYTLGRTLAADGYPWHTTPPGLAKIAPPKAVLRNRD